MLNSGSTTFMILCTSLVMLMTPGLAFFYGGLAGKRNILGVMMQTFVSLGITIIMWVTIGYSLCFSGGEGGIIGNLDLAFLNNIPFDEGFGPEGKFPTYIFIAYQMMFAIITPALITGAFVNRVTFKAYLIFLVLWQLFVYYPFVHMIWGGGVFGTILLGVFASKAINNQSGLLEGDVAFFMKELAAVVVSAVYAFIFTYLMLVIINKFTPEKVSEEHEDLGLDHALHGEKAYDEGAL